MKVQELLEYEFTATKLDRMLTSMAPKKKGQPIEVKAKNAWSAYRSKGEKRLYEGISRRVRK